MVQHVSETTIQRLRLVVDGCKSNLVVSLPIFLFLLGFLIYFAYLIIDTVVKYMQMRKQSEDIKAARFGNLSLSNTNLFADSSNDNEVYGNITPEKKEAEKDDYTAITTTIQNSFKQYQAYNEKLSKFYKDTKTQEPPDRIDSTVLLGSNDNY